MYDAVTVGCDRTGDVALIKLYKKRPDEKFPVAELGDSSTLRPGDWTLIMGNAQLLSTDFTPSVSFGLVSGVGRYSDFGFAEHTDAIQFDTAANQGNSGGPIFNMDGQVIAISTAIVSPSGGSVGIGFATPSELVIPIVNQLRGSGHIERGWLGVSVEDSNGGVTVANVERTSPAARAGIRQGDLIVAVNGDHIETSRGLIRAVAAVSPGANVNLSIRRQGRDVDVPVTVGRRPSESAAEGAR